MVNKLVIGVALATIALPASAQDDEGPRRTRVIVGAQVGPAFPGASRGQVTPYLDLSRTRGDRDYTFEAPDESTSISIYRSNGFSIGPAINFQGKRRLRDAGGLDEVGFAVEVGASAQLSLDPSFRLTAEARRGVTGHSGFTGMVGADYVQRDGNRWLWSIGPRVTLGDAKYARAYFGVTPRETLATGIASYRPESMVMVGGTSSLLYQFTPRWGAFGYGKYDRIVGAAADSPVTRLFGSRNQWSAGGGISYTFGRDVR
ncbi:MipA/OmpV family protein [Sphingomonas floccifaciens]|uniref:MipA/OmpV family protein n=1 Tax=Sphingomonas floccifaciens TaxID=1844115 RepID=A0ABW4NAK1_9SPHN